jgi:hypothetical protein
MEILNHLWTIKRITNIPKVSIYECFYNFLSFLGACIHLRDPELALAIESCLKGLLQAYCCHNHADERVLQALMKRFYPPGTSRPQIIVSEFRSEMYDVRHR